MGFQGCVQPSGPEDPGNEFANQMYHAIPLEPLREEVGNQLEYNPHGRNMRPIPEGTIAYGKAEYVYPYPNTNEGYEAAGQELKNPLPKSLENMAEGQRLFSIYCYPCHGTEGRGDGPIIPKFPAPPAYQSDNLRILPSGKIYHVITYGKNLMGSYASQLQPEERWKVVMWVQKLQRLDIDEPDSEVPETDPNVVETPDTLVQHSIEDGSVQEEPVIDVE